MEAKVKTALWVFLLFAGLGVRLFPEDARFIKTDAAGGIFTSDRKLSFELLRPGSLRLLLDGREIYRGEGPAYPELGLPQGEERAFTLAAEYYSPEDNLLESRSWYISIDKKAPPLPALEFRHAPGGLRLFGSGEKDAAIRALAETDGKLVFFRDFGESVSGLTDSFWALVWAEDLAGNCSEIRNEYFEIPPVKIENPVPGEWLNTQTLIISGAEGKALFWTADGTNPLEAGGTGRPYRGPERIEKTGPVTLRVAWLDSAGTPRERRLDYSAAGNLAGVSNESPYAAFAKAEEREISTRIFFPVPASCLWSMGGVPRLEGGRNIVLRPEAGIKRSAALHLSEEAGSGGMYRFAYLLDGSDGEQSPAPAPAFTTPAEVLLVPGTSGEDPNEQNSAPALPRLFAAGRRRLVLWPETQGTLYYSLRNGPWLEAGGPLPIPLEGGTLRWFTLKDEDGAPVNGVPVSGPDGVLFASLETAKIPPDGDVVRAAAPPSPGSETPGGRIVCRAYGENSGWNYVSAPADYVPGMLKDFSPDVCDGEDIEWAFISSGGEVLEQYRRDRLAPPAPELSAPPQGSWNRGPLRVGVVSNEEDTSGHIKARLRYVSGPEETFDGTGTLDIVSSLGEEAEVIVEAFLQDAAGNRGQITERRFVLDPKTIYVSSEALLSKPASPEPLLRGGMDNPFTSLEEALDYALKQDRGDIRVAGTHELRNPVTVSRNIRIDGGWTKNGVRASLSFGGGFCWNINPGAELVLSELNAERKEGDKPLVRAGKNSGLEIVSSAFIHGGPFLLADSAVCELKDSQITAEISGEMRTAAFSAENSGFRIHGSRILAAGNNTLLFDLRGGSFAAEKSEFLSSGEKTASVFSFAGTRGEFSGLVLSASARDFAAVLEASDSGLVWNGGTVKVSARDSCAVLLDKCAAMILGAGIRLEGSSTARALEIRGSFPWIQNCVFSFEGSAGNPELFSGTEADYPRVGSVTGNSFLGFARIRGPLWNINKLEDFNRAYASPDKPNSAGEAPVLPASSSGPGSGR